ncbi:hypothetical protein LVJ82_17330 [Vitreoscilla massiliensis]|uniref:Portal protein n=1 Tax=Vitreoscilla massiliensis TaxID=1689272 RepID=A0ABY4E090_9NEIS|nr:hypothetical protein [Vitreoscilla massiliensis]UOO89183.1 hypothetical protein LVJ82_17330 [Vitreoscilla massiliensis]
MSQQSVILDKNGDNFQLATPEEIYQASNEAMVDFDSVTIGQMLASNQQTIRNRIEIYGAYQYMASDPIIATALNLHVTQSLGAHETTSEVFFIESKPDAKGNEIKIIEELRDDLAPLLNKMAYEIAYSGATFGDAYARIYSKPKTGVEEIYFGDKLHSAIIQPMMRGEKTIGYVVALENSNKRVSMSTMQIARFKMPRMGMVSQQRILLNAWNDSILEDDLSKHKPLPDTIGGSFLQDAERPYYLLQNALFGLNSSRIMDAVQESLITLNMEGMNNTQQKKFVNAMTKMLTATKNKLHEAISAGRPITERIRHILPVSSEKQLTQIDTGLSGSGNSNSFNIDDVMLYARMLAAALGQDLSMLGFADQLSGGLGDGGFYRVSAQGAQRAIWIRQGFTDFVNYVIDIHMQQKYGGIFKNRPYEITFIGAQTALEKEKQDIQERRSMSSATTLQVMQQLIDLGWDEKSIINFLKNQMSMDEDDALLYAKQLAKKQSERPQESNEQDFNE